MTDGVVMPPVQVHVAQGRGEPSRSMDQHDPRGPLMMKMASVLISKLETVVSIIDARLMQWNLRQKRKCFLLQLGLRAPHSLRHRPRQGSKDARWELFHVERYEWAPQAGRLKLVDDSSNSVAFFQRVSTLNELGTGGYVGTGLLTTSMRPH